MVWIPGYTRKDLGPDGGPYDSISNPKGCIHTTEGTTLAGAELAYSNYPPHIGYDPIRRIKHQYIPLTRCSYAFRGSESDDEFVIQIEIVGFADTTHNWTDRIYRNIAEDVVRPLEQLVRIPRNSLRFYRANEGIVLARPDSPIRLSLSALRAYRGWLGHQHIPAPDSHWDPGGFRMDKVFAFLTEDDMEWTDSFKFAAPDGKVITVDYGTAIQNLYVWMFYGSNTEPWKGPSGVTHLKGLTARPLPVPADIDEAVLAEEMAKQGIGGASVEDVKALLQALVLRAQP